LVPASAASELAGEVNELVRSSCRFYRNFREEDVHVTVVRSQAQVLPEVAPTLREFARKKMEKAGITILLNSRKRNQARTYADFPPACKAGALNRANLRETVL
jgi:hypothetical protein